MVQENEFSEREIELHGQYSRYNLAKHKGTGLGVQQHCAKIRYECEELLNEQGGVASASFKRFSGVLDRARMYWARIRGENIEDLTNITKIGRRFRLNPAEEAVNCELYTRGHADPRRAREIWLVYTDQWALVLGFREAYLLTREGWYNEEAKRPPEIQELERFDLILNQFRETQ